MGQDLGELHHVDVRKCWASEANDFTPWLAREDNIQRLAEVIGYELEVENTEVAVGPYSADIVAKDVGSGRYVVVENLLGKTNHDHVGKLLTYGAALNAAVLVLIATDFSEEHQKVLDWLNENSTDEVGFFGVRVELWRIDNSAPAVRFTLVSQPPTPTRRVAKASATKSSGVGKLQYEFWTEFEKQLKASRQVPSTHTPRPQYWYNVALGRSTVYLSCFFDSLGKRIGVRVYLQNRTAEEALAQLTAQREDIERELGERLKWDPHPEKRDRVILLTRSADIEARDEWADYLSWLLDKTLRMREVFGPRVKSLKLG